MSDDPSAVVRLRWLGPDEGGRSAPPAGPRYVATARVATLGLAGEDVDVVLDLAPDGQLAVLRLLTPGHPEDAAGRIRPGARFVILDHRQVVAQGEVQYVADGTPTADSLGGRPGA